MNANVIWSFLLQPTLNWIKCIFMLLIMRQSAIILIYRDCVQCALADIRTEAREAARWISRRKRFSIGYTKPFCRLIGRMVPLWKATEFEAIYSARKWKKMYFDENKFLDFYPDGLTITKFINLKWLTMKWCGESLYNVKTVCQKCPNLEKPQLCCFPNDNVIIMIYGNRWFDELGQYIQVICASHQFSSRSTTLSF